MFSSPSGRERRASRGNDPFETRRELRRLQRRRNDRVMLAMVVLGPVLLILMYELGRSMLHMQGVKTFAATIDQRPSADIKHDLEHYAQMLTDYNPLVRNAGMAALKVATGWNAGNNPAEWRRMWSEQEPYWEYRRAVTNAPAPDWRSQLPATP